MVFSLLLMTTGCASSESARFRVQYRNGREITAFPIAVGARTPLSIMSDRFEETTRITAIDRDVQIEDSSVLVYQDNRLVGLSPGDTTIAVTATVDGVRGTVKHPVRVREVATTVWNLDGSPLTQDLVVLSRGDLGFTVHHQSSAGEQLIADGLEVPLPAHAELHQAGGLPEFTLVHFESAEPGRFAIPETPWSIEVVPTWDEVEVEGSTVKLLNQGRAPYLRAPGPKIEALSDCKVASRAKGTNPFTLQATVDQERTCSVQITVEGRAFVVEATFEPPGR